MAPHLGAAGRPLEQCGHQTAERLEIPNRDGGAGAPSLHRGKENDRAEIVAAETQGCDLAALPLAALQSFSPAIGDDVYQVLALEGSVASRNHIGGTAPEQVRSAVQVARALIAA